jgi:Bacterial TSP3 repeat
MSGRCPADYAWKRGVAILTAGALLIAAAVVAILSPLADARPRDRDRDGLKNRFERKRSHTNPRRADTDRDRLRDRFELRRSNTNPRRADTDRDRLRDRREVKFLNTNPRKRDTDGDGLGDGREVKRLRTNPRKRDTDGDGVSDRREIRRGTNPRRKPRRKRRQVAPPPSAAPAPSSAFPTPATTGVPDGWRPSATHNGTLTVSQAGTQINGMLVTGSIEVRAPNVTIRNSRVYGRIYNQANNTMYNGLLVEDTEIGPDSGNNNQTAGSLGSGGYVARRVHIHNSTEGFRVGGFNYSRGVAGPVVIQDSFVDLDDNGSCAHADGVQEFDWGPRLDINHNTIDMRNVGCSTAPIYLNNAGPKTVTNNLIMGGSYSLRLHGGGSYEAVAGNRLVQGAWDHGPVLVDSCTGIANWSDNRLVNIDAAYNITTLGGLITRC